MATTTLRFDLSWENDNAIQLTRKEDEGEAILIAKMDENGNMAAGCKFMAEIFNDAFNRAVKRACDEMIV